MMRRSEKEPRSGETLIFGTPEEAREFAEGVEKRARRENLSGARRRREVVAEELAGEFAKQGEDVSLYTQPWEHTEDEHEEVQKLVDLAFLEDLPIALRRARKSDSYPRNIDLLHDVLTGQMYELMVKRGINKQPVKQSVVIVLTALALVLTIIFLMIMAI